jgi:hypothetical protein
MLSFVFIALSHITISCRRHAIAAYFRFHAMLAFLSFSFACRRLSALAFAIAARHYGYYAYFQRQLLPAFQHFRFQLAAAACQMHFRLFAFQVFFDY